MKLSKIILKNNKLVNRKASKRIRNNSGNRRNLKLRK